MSTFLPNDILDDLAKARRGIWQSSRRLRVEAGSQRLSVTRVWEGGFALHAQAAPSLRGLVDIYDGTRHLKRCLIVACEEDGEEMRYELKVVNEATDQQPVDFERDINAPTALLPPAI